MATFEYVDTQNKVQKVEAPDEQTALKTATNIAPTSGVVSANALANPVTAPTVPQPKQPTQPEQFVSSFDSFLQSTQKDTDDRIAAARESSQDILSQLTRESQFDSKGMFDTSFREQGGDTALKSLQDESLRLAQLQGKFRSMSERVSSGQGQSKIFESAQLSEVGRQEAVEVGNQALVVAALQGNVNTARQIALDVTEFAYQDKQLKLEGIKNQLDVAQQYAQADTARAIERERTLVTKELDDITRAKEAVQTAIASGSASTEELQTLTSQKVDDRTKEAVAQQIVARAARLDKQIEQGQIALNNRLKLVQLAAAGDKSAIKQLGYDPNAVDNAQEYEQKTAETQNTLDVASNLVNNKTGLKLATGAFQSPLLTSLRSVIGGAGAGAAGGSVIPGVGTAIGAGVGAVTGLVGGLAVDRTQLVNKKMDFLSDLTYLVNTEGFQEFINFKESGLTFGSLTEGERNAIFSAANELNSSIEPDENGRVKAVRASEQKTRENIEKVVYGLQKVQDELNAQNGVTSDEFNEIRNLR
jgi:hypothetical protein